MTFVLNYSIQKSHLCTFLFLKRIGEKQTVLDVQR